MHRIGGFFLVVGAATAAGCELSEITVVGVEDVVIAEVYATLTGDSTLNEVRAFLHRTVGSELPDIDPLSNSQIVVTRTSDGLALPMREQNADDCVLTLAPGASGVCFTANPDSTPLLKPGDQLEADIRLYDGRRLHGTTRVPSRFEIEGDPRICTLVPGRQLPIHWSRSEGAWAYVNETSLRGLPSALRPEGIIVEEDPLYLLGLSVSDQDTTIVFPREFGLFNRFDLDQALAVRLQAGIPAKASAQVSITAVDRNYVNWARGGNFNPSGQVRVPSLVGDGTGVFAATVNRRFIVLSAVLLPDVPRCPGSGGIE